MKLQDAKIIANKYIELLKPYTNRISVAGSIRREKPEVKDIEIVCIRDENQVEGFSRIVNSFGKIIKGKPIGKYMQIEIEEEI